jgi:ABC-type uncharacterized transport system ATPase subunit
MLSSKNMKFIRNIYNNDKINEGQDASLRVEMGNPNENVLQVEGLTKTFGRRTVVNDISFNVKRGEMFGYLGPNGSGKTTTIRMALGIIRPNDGSVSILGSPPDRSVFVDRQRKWDTKRQVVTLDGISTCQVPSPPLS